MERAAPRQTTSRTRRAGASAAVSEEVAAGARSPGSSAARPSFGTPMTQVRNPLSYARRSHADRIRRHGAGRNRVVFLAMKPGPSGMAKTGVTLGAVDAVNDRLGLEASASRLRREHPERPALGFHRPRDQASSVRIQGILHRSRANPRAQRDRGRSATRELADRGLRTGRSYR